MTFEEYLKSIHSSQDRVSTFEAWIDAIRPAYIIEEAENWHKSELQSMRAKGANTTNSKYSKEQRSEWARRGGKPKKKIC